MSALMGSELALLAAAQSSVWSFGASLSCRVLVFGLESIQPQLEKTPNRSFVANANTSVFINSKLKLTSLLIFIADTLFRGE